MLKIKEGFVLREVAGKFIVVSVGDRVKEFNGLINLNETGAFLWKLLERGTDEKEMKSEIMATYDVDDKTAEEGVNDFVAIIKEANLLK